MTERGPMLRVIRVPAVAAGRWLRSIKPERRFLRADLMAGLPGAISSVPDGMAAAVLVGVNPVQAGSVRRLRGPIAAGSFHPPWGWVTLAGMRRRCTRAACRPG